MSPKERDLTRSLLEKLNGRPGRGGVRLSYEEAQIAVRLLAAGRRARLKLDRFEGR